MTKPITAIFDSSTLMVLADGSNTRVIAADELMLVAIENQHRIGIPALELLHAYRVLDDDRARELTTILNNESNPLVILSLDASAAEGAAAWSVQLGLPDREDHAAVIAYEVRWHNAVLATYQPDSFSQVVPGSMLLNLAEGW
jgi:hypothetical protein